MITSKGKPESLRLRSATPADCRRLWEWRNESATRAASFETGVILREAHDAWYAQRLADLWTRVFIVVDAGGQEVGYARVEIDGQDAEISVSIDRSARGRGYGVEAIRTAVEKVLTTEDVRRVVARIRRDNPASLATFLRAGFRVVGDSQVGGVEAYETVYEPTDDWDAPRSVVFRVQAGADVGLGHLQRCLSLASALRGLGVHSIFLTTKDPFVIRRVSQAGFTVVTLDGVVPWTLGDADQLVHIAAGDGAAVIVDSESAGPDYLWAVRRAGLLSMALDDGASHRFPCHIVVNGDAHALELRYESVTGHTMFLLGPRYAILREEFWRLPPPVRDGHVRNVLVTAGGADARGLTTAFMTALEGIPGDFSLTVVVGPFAANSSEIERAAARSTRRVRVVRWPESLAPMILEADLAVSAAGQTLYELACAGCPAVAAATAANQVAQLRALAAAGTVTALEPSDGLNLTAALASACASMVEDSAARARMSDAGRRLIDGAGAARVARALLAVSREWCGSPKAVSPAVAPDPASGKGNRR